MPTLAIYLDAPMMSWGASSKFQYRETGAFPTKSGLIGLLAAAVGIDKHKSDEAEKLAPLAALKLTVVKISKPDISTSRLTDFHTVGGGYDKKASLREKMSIPKKASGAPFGTVITRRSYLTDAAFIALFEGEAAVLDPLKSALLDPVWGVWFGRKTCLPATPLTPTIGNSPQQALDALSQIIPGLESQPLEDCEYQAEVSPGATIDQGTFFQSDQPTAFGHHQGPVPAPYQARGIIHHRP